MATVNAKRPAQWTQKANTVRARYRHSCGTVGGNKVVAAGGVGFYSDTEIFDVAANTWLVEDPVSSHDEVALAVTFLGTGLN